MSTNNRPGPKTNLFVKPTSPVRRSEESVVYSRGLKGDFGKGSICPASRSRPDAWLLGDRRPRLPVRATESNLSRVHGSPRPAQPLALRSGVSDAGPNPLDDQAPLQLGDRAQDVKTIRPAGVDVSKFSDRLTKSIPSARNVSRALADAKRTGRSGRTSRRPRRRSGADGRPP